MTGATTLEEQVASLTKIIEDLAKQVQHQDDFLSPIAGKIVDHEQRPQVTKANPRELHLQEVPTPSKTIPGLPQTTLQQSQACLKGSRGMLQALRSFQLMERSPQLREFILGAIKYNQDEVTPSYSYLKANTSRIDQLKMRHGYQPPKFQQFDGVGNSKKHIAHFVETCNNAGTNGDHMVKKFVRSLKHNAFEWYTKLEPTSINKWTQLECEFLHRFFSTRRIVRMIELTNAKTRKDEPITDSINIWRSLSLKCNDKLLEISTISMCIQGIY
ncbi:hypothetical protein LIER_36720 [Lithospermum erythrorhizon]|uniref:Retrotransposon gag domain-containing protein n=1 Tax=Lithospermum erythrorhizon TaxID=34254 RepID=A0AAV3PB85_LITER